jgi:3-dehydroquinate synthase
MGLTRSDVMIAVGGGVIGDITGFAASTYMRGIDYIQVPTTLLSMVDSSVGGKTAIDMKDAKNIVGTFYQPKAVFININFLKTLDKKQFSSGLGEILKYAFIEESCGYEQSLFLFEYLTLCCEKMFEKEAMTLMRIIEYCLKLKISIVNQDEKENDLRRVLNLGHTLAHALETKGRYKTYTHGEAVIQGIFFVLDWAHKNDLISYSYCRLSCELLTKYGFHKEDISNKYKPEELVELMKKDKKSLRDKIRFIVPCDKKKVKEVQLTQEETLAMF